MKPQTLYNSQVEANQQFKSARIAWCQPLAHHARRDQHEIQLQLRPVEECPLRPTFPLSATPPDKAEVGLLECALHSSWRTSSRSILSRRIFHGADHFLSLASLIFQSVFVVLLPLALRTLTSWFVSANLKYKLSHSGPSSLRNCVPVRLHKRPPPADTDVTASLQIGQQCESAKKLSQRPCGGA